MRHLFLSELAQKDKIPVFIELRDLNASNLVITDLICQTLRNLSFNLNNDYISKAMEAGHFAIFLDGYDEISYDLRVRPETS